LKPPTSLDQRITTALRQVQDQPYFYKSEVAAALFGMRDVAEMLKGLRKRYPEWRLDQIVRRDVETQIGRRLQDKDRRGIRLYECYAVGGPERRWMLFTSMPAEALQKVINETRELGSRIDRKIALYTRLHAVCLARPGATVGDVIDEVLEEEDTALG